MSPLQLKTLIEATLSAGYRKKNTYLQRSNHKVAPHCLSDEPGPLNRNTLQRTGVGRVRKWGEIGGSKLEEKIKGANGEEKRGVGLSHVGAYMIFFQKLSIAWRMRFLLERCIPRHSPIARGIASNTAIPSGASV
eukprot:2475163-Rhodomonas_salina.2